MDGTRFEILTDLSAMNPQQIDTNYEAAKAYLDELIAPYRTLIVTEEGLAGARKNLADIRKLKDSINAQKIAAKKEWMAPFAKFEEQCKTLMAICDQGADNIDAQIKAADAARKQAKLDRLRDYFMEKAGRAGTADYLKWEDVLSARWGNSTVRENAAQEEISQKIEDTAADLDFIRGMHSEYEAVMLDDYRENHDLKSAMGKASRLKELKSAEERRKEAALNFPPPEEKSSTEAAERPLRAIPEPEQMIRPAQAETEERGQKTYKLRFEVEVTLAQANELKVFFTERGIKYRRN